jgi:hypothetical protein
VERFINTHWADGFSGLGTTDDIPKPLRLREGTKVANKRWSKLQAEKLAAEIWEVRAGWWGWWGWCVQLCATECARLCATVVVVSS